ncbi:MAG: cyclic nucleotide-binding domain-containing protein [Actinobacteria bacterium]|nr:cyclic nucleotide-binding domain-containing protein [Actinomycetota bacterium]
MSIELLNHQVFNGGEVIFKAGESPRCAYLIQSGAVNILAGREDHAPIVTTLVAGDLLGEMALVDAQPRSATAVAKQTTTCITIMPGDFGSRLAKSDPLVRAMVKSLTRRLRQTTPTRVSA